MVRDTTLARRRSDEDTPAMLADCTRLPPRGNAMGISLSGGEGCVAVRKKGSSNLTPAAACCHYTFIKAIGTVWAAILERAQS